MSLSVKSGICLIHILISALVILAVLSAVGISRPRNMKMSTWCWIYIAIAVSFDLLTAIAVIFKNAWLIEVLVGVAAGSATSLAYHVWKDMRELDEHHNH